MELEPDDPDEPPAAPDVSDWLSDEPDAAVLALVDDGVVLDELAAEATSVPELLPLAAESAAEDDPLVEVELAPPTTVSSSSPPLEPSLPTVGMLMSVGLRPGGRQAA